MKTYRDGYIIKNPLFPSMRVKIFIRQSITGNFKETDKSKSAKFKISPQEKIDREGCELTSELSLIKTYWKEEELTQVI